MQVISLKSDGTVTIEMTAEEASAVCNDIGSIAWNKVGEPTDKLHSFLTAADPAAAHDGP